MSEVYLSVSVKSGASVTVPTSVIKFSASSTYWDLFETIWIVEKPTLMFKFTPEDISTVCIAIIYYEYGILTYPE